MKKKWLLPTVMACSLIMTMFTGCTEKEPEPLRICVDVAYTKEYGDYYEPIEEAMERFLTQLENAGGPTDIVVECIPDSGAEREVALERIRVEIASGSGPDIFITNCDEKDSFSDTKESLFLMPEKSMSLDLFLPLDEYIEENTRYAEWENMNAVVLAAGRDDEGQQIIPLSYTLPVVVYHQAEAQHIPSKEITWDDMLETEDDILAAAAVWTDNTNTNMEGCPFANTRDALPEFILGDLADYEEEELLFTEEEFGQCFEDIYTLANRYTAGEFDSAPRHYNAFAGAYFTDGADFIDSNGELCDANNGITMYDPMTMVPLYSEDGGVTASITAYAAINRNTPRPEEAYAVIDFLLSVEAQRTGGLYQYLYYSDGYSLPMHNEIMNGKDYSLYVLDLDRPDNHNFEWYLPQENFEVLRTVREQITHAQFRDVLDVQLDEAYREYDRAVKYGSDNPNEVIAEYYRAMQQMLRE